MKSTIRPLAAMAMLGLLAGCTAGNGALEPPFTSVNLNNDKVQVATGVATFSNGSKGLNVVATFRQPNGLSATLLNTPTLTGPFTVPSASGTRSAASSLGTSSFLAACSPNADTGTGHITGSAQQVVTANAACTTFGQAGGVFAYGFAPENSTTGQAASYLLWGDGIVSNSFSFYGAPFYGSAGLVSDNDGGLDNPGCTVNAFSCEPWNAFRGGPPSYPRTTDGTFPTNFLGFTLGYTVFAMAPVTGAYNLSVNVPSGNNPGATLTASTFNLTSTTGLPAFGGAPTFTSDGLGGGTAACTAPAGVTETIVELLDEGNFSTGDGSTTAYYTQVVNGGGAVSVAFGDNMGPGHTASATLKSGDTYEVVCIGADYPLFEAGPPGNTSQTPTLVGSAGQTDIVFSPSLETTY